MIILFEPTIDDNRTDEYFKRTDEFGAVFGNILEGDLSRESFYIL